MFDLRDFSKLMSAYMKGGDEMEDELRESFKLFDLNGDGYVTFDELRTAMTTIGEPMTDVEVNELFQLCDLNKDGKIDYEGITGMHSTVGYIFIYTDMYIYAYICSL